MGARGGWRQRASVAWRRLRCSPVVILVVIAMVVSGVGYAAFTRPAQAATATGGSFVPLSPQRITDTRANSGEPNADKTLAPHGGLNITLPATVPQGAAGVVLSMTAVDATAAGFLAVYPTGQASPPLESVLNFVAGPPGCLSPGCVVPNLVITPVGLASSVTVYNGSGGSVDVIVDLEGYFNNAAATSGTAGEYYPLAPARLADTRCGEQPPHSGGGSDCAPGRLPAPNSALSTLSARQTTTVAVGGQGGVPLTASAVVLQVTAADTSGLGQSYFTTFPAGEDRPLASDVNWVPGQETSTRVVVALGTGGAVDVYNNAGQADLVVDVVGYFADASTQSAPGQFYQPMTPVRFADSRPDYKPHNANTLGPQASQTLQITGANGVPSNATSAIVNLTEATATGDSFLTVTPKPLTPPASTSDLNFAPGQTTANADLATLSPTGSISVYNNVGQTNFVVDLFGYFVSSTPPPPSTPPPSGPASTTSSSTSSSSSSTSSSSSSTSTSSSTTSTSSPTTQPTTPVLLLSFGSATSTQEVLGTTANLAVTVTLGGHPDSGVTVSVAVTGPNAQTLSPAPTDANGQTATSYLGKASGTDTITATGGGATSNQLQITWGAPAAGAATTQVAGQFFPEPSGSSTFVATPKDTPAFGQTFPDIEFDPPYGLVPVPPGAPTTATTPFSDIVTDAGGGYAGTVPAQGNGSQAGVDDSASGGTNMTSFDAVFQGNLVVGQAGYVTLGVVAGDGFILGIGGGATGYSGVSQAPPVSGTTPFSTYPVDAAENSCLDTAAGATEPGDYPVTIKVPAAGSYPYEIDYFSCNTTAQNPYDNNKTEPVRSLVLRVEGVSPAAPSSPTVYVGYADDSHSQVFRSFPYPWVGTPGVNLQVCNPAPQCSYDGGAIRVDNTSSAPITINKLVVTMASDVGPYAPYNCVYDIWAPDVPTGANAPNGLPKPSTSPVVLQPGQVVIYGQETRGEDDGCENTNGQFDTSDVPNTGCTQSQIIPRIDLTIDNKTSTYYDDNQILNTAGVDRANCAPYPDNNESQAWIRIAGPGTGTDVPLPPQVGLTLTPTQAVGGGPLTNTVGDPQTFTATATGADGTNLVGVPVTFTVTGQNPTTDTVDTNSNGVASFTYTGTIGGTDTVSAEGNFQGLEMASGLVDLTWNIPPKGQTTGSGGTQGEAPPQITVTSPIQDATLSGPTTVTATITPPVGQTVSSWTVALTPQSGSGTPMALGPGGTGTSVSAPLDPAHLTAGAYTITVTATASGGGANAATAPVQIGRMARVGHFTETYQDFTASIGGVPVTLSRTYDSFDKTVGDFGVGWRLSLSQVSVATNGPLGAGGWTAVPDNCSLLGCTYAYTSSTVHTATVTLPGGTQEVFNFTPLGGFGPLFFLNGGGAFAPRPNTNTTGTLAVFDDPGVEYGFDGNLYSASSAGQYLYGATDNAADPRVDFLYTDASGTQYLISTTYGLLAERQANGSCLAYTPGGVYSTVGLNTAVGDNGNGNGTCTANGGNGTAGGGQISIARDSQDRITTITDPDNHTYTYAYDTNGNLAAVTLPLTTVSATDTYTYDTNHNLLSQTGPGAPTLTQTYNADGTLASITDPNGTVRVASDPGARTTSLTDALGKLQTVLTYDPQGDLTKQEQVDLTDNKTRTTTYSYDARGDLLSTTDPVGNTTSATYDGNGNQLTSTDADGNTTTNTYDASSNLLSTTDPLRNTTSYTYDSAGNLLTLAEPSGATTAFGYDKYGNYTALTDPEGHNYSLGYNYNKQVTTVTDPLGHGQGLSYDSSGDMTDSYNGAGDTQYTYDAQRRLVGVTNPDNQKSATTYNAQGQVTSTTDADGNVTYYSYDGAGQLVTITDSSTPTPGTVTLTYDADGNLTSTTDPDGQKTTYAYDAFGDRISTTAPGGHTTTYSYDADGRITSTTDADGQTTTYTYDPNGNVTGQKTSAGATTWTYDADNRAATMTDSTGTSTYTYDADGEVTQVDSPAGTIGYTYNPNGQRASMTLPSGRITYDYDAAGNLTNEDGLGQQLTFTYDAANRLATAASFPSATVTTYRYDGASRINEVYSTVNGASPPLQNDVYTRDADGNPTQVQYVDGTTTTYTYDKLGRLLTATGPGTTSYAYTYDAAGNIASVAVDGAAPTPYTYANGRLSTVGGQAVTTDAEGNVTAIGSGAGRQAFGYDSLGQLTSTTTGGATTSYAYDGSGLRVSTASGGTTTPSLWDVVNPANGSLEVAPQPPSAIPGPDSSGTNDTASTPGVDGNSGLPQLVSQGSDTFLQVYGAPITEIDPTGATAYLPDGLGSITGTVSPSGTYGATTYAPFGQVTGQTGTPPEFGFTGQLTDDTGLDYLRGRTLDPAIGQFLTPDSVQPNAPGTQGFDPYAYVTDTPTALVDPSGHQAIVDFAVGELTAVAKTTLLSGLADSLALLTVQNTALPALVLGCEVSELAAGSSSSQGHFLSCLGNAAFKVFVAGAEKAITTLLPKFASEIYLAFKKDVAFVGALMKDSGAP